MPHTPEEESLKNLHVLVVDDDLDICSYIKDLLLEIGIVNVLTAGDGDQAIKIFMDPSRPVDLIICDWMMPGKNGLVVLKLVRVKFPDLPFMMLTAKGTAADVQTAHRAGVTGYIIKPFQPEDLQDKILKLARDIHRKEA